jgi:hypothetical protein
MKHTDDYGNDEPEALIVAVAGSFSHTELKKLFSWR